MNDPMNDVLEEKITGLKTYLDEKFKGIDKRFDSNKEEHTRIIDQTTKTNGRVNKLEAWQNRVVGAMVIVNAVILPLVLWLVINHLER